MEAVPRQVEICIADNGSEPFSEWLARLDSSVKVAVLRRIKKVRSGLMGDCKFVANGVYELRFDIGPGYRIYFGQRGSEVHLISGGDKSTQQADIKYATNFWSEYED